MSDPEEGSQSLALAASLVMLAQAMVGALTIGAPITMPRHGTRWTSRAGADLATAVDHTSWTDWRCVPPSSRRVVGRDHGP